MISDHVKGKQKEKFSPGIQKGIHLHRVIDAYTDEHPASKEAKIFFKPYYRLYSGAIVDIIYDHFLATDEAEFPDNFLYEFSIDTYETLDPYTEIFPERFGKMFPWMKKQNWLYNYQHKEGIQKSLNGLMHRAAYLEEMDTAFSLFDEYYERLKDCYTNFWADAKPHFRKRFEELITD
ncbi:MAG TPA: ACP phosphodiesterase [Chitinophagaceae bacterium]|nr:ACP phosphodiesterase [Chitinophagaceae bacterium]HRX92940.1 ACP phosphodiesterase [Chitinophagaceae bacterium]